MKIILGFIVFLVLLFPVAMYFLPDFLPVEMIKGIAKKQVREMAGLDLDFKSLSFNWDGGVIVEGISLAKPDAEDPAGEPSLPLLAIDKAQTNVSLVSLLHGKLVVNSLRVDGFGVNVRRLADGRLDIPDFGAPPPSGGTAARAMRHGGRDAFLAAAAEKAEGKLPPIEVRRVELAMGRIRYQDDALGLEHEAGIDFVRIDGAALDDPFALTGRILPYAGQADKGEVSLVGRVAMVKEGRFNPEGEATLEFTVKSLSLHELADKLGFGGLIASAVADGMVKAGMTNGKAVLSVPGLNLVQAKVNAGLGGERLLPLPDTKTGLDLEFDPGAGALTLSRASLENVLANINALGVVEGIDTMADGGTPAANIDFTGSANFAGISDFLSSQDNLGLGVLPRIDGSAHFLGTLSLPPAGDGAAGLQPALALDFSDGSIHASHEELGASVDMKLAGIGLRSAAKLGQRFEVNSGVTLANVEVQARFRPIGDAPVAAVLNGGGAISASGESVAFELRSADTTVSIPDTPWCSAMTIAYPETRIAFDLVRDELDIAAARMEIGQSVKAAVSSGHFTGFLAGAPRGQADIAFSALAQELRTLFSPLLPAEITEVAGSIRSAVRVAVADERLEAGFRTEIDQAEITADIPEGKAALGSQKNQFTLKAGLGFANPQRISLSALEFDAVGSTLRFMDGAGNSAAGRFGPFLLKAEGTLDAASGQAVFAALTLQTNGMNVAFGKGAQQTAGLSAGIMQLTLAAKDRELVIPLGPGGDFNLPAADAGADGAVFYRLADGKRQDSPFGNVRARLGVNGHIGRDKPQVINLTAAQLSATPVAAQAKGRLDLDSGALEAAYAGQIRPAGLASIFEHLKLPPALLIGAMASGSLSWTGGQLASRGTAKGEMRLPSGETHSFELNHDITASLIREEESLAIGIRRLDGNVKSAGGEPVATLAAQQSNLVINRQGGNGLLDIRLQGAAGPTRSLALGLAGIVPDLGDVAHALNQTLAEGVYNAWIQLKDKGNGAIGANLGGVWQGAAVSYNGASLLAEPGKLTASVEGEFSRADRRVKIDRVLLRSDSALAQADGKAEITLRTDAADAVAGLSGIEADFRFVLADISKLSLVFPFAIPRDVVLRGKVDGAMKATGDPANAGRGALSLSAVWQGAAVQRGGAAFLEEPGKLSAALESEFSLTDYWFRARRFQVHSDSGLMRAEGTAEASLVKNADGSPGGLAGFGTDIRFAVTKLDVLQSVMPREIGIRGRMDGSLKAAVNPQNRDVIDLAAAGAWEGASLSMGGTRLLEEPGKLSAALEGDLDLAGGRVRFSRLRFASDTGQAQAEGSAEAAFSVDSGGAFTGLGGVAVDFRFAAADAARLGAVFPGVVTPSLGLKGRVDGVLKAGGSADNIQVREAAIRFSQFQASPGGLELRIPSGAATFNATLSIPPNPAPAGNDNPYAVLTYVNAQNGGAALTGAVLQGRPVNDLRAAFELRDGMFRLDSAQFTLGGDQAAAGSITAAGTVNFASPAPAVSMNLNVRNLPLEHLSAELAEYLTVQSGAVNLPAGQGTASVAFSGFSEQEALRTIRLDNFTFATGPVTVVTGPLLNQELDRMRGLMKLTPASGEARQFTFTRITGSAVANGTGVVAIPAQAPIDVFGENTGNFRIQGIVTADETLDLDAMVSGRLEEVIGFSLPNIIPNLRQQSDETKRTFMNRLNQNAANGHYKVKISGPLANPAISGIPELVARILADIVAAAPFAVIGGVIDIGHGAVDIVKNPQNIGRTLGNIIGGGQQETQPDSPQPQQGDGPLNLFGRMLGGQEAQEGARQDPDPQQQQRSNPLNMFGRMLGGERQH